MNPFKSSLMCHLCDKTYSYEKRLAAHVLKHGNALISTEKNSCLTIKKEQHIVYECLQCGEIFSKPQSVLEHCKTAEKHENIIQSLNNSNTIDIQTLETHNDIPFTSIQDLVPFLKLKSTSSLLLCEFCDMPFISAVHLFTHMISHNPRLGYQCLNCDEKKPTVLKIQKHREEECDFKVFDSLKMIDINRSYVCNVCENEFDDLQKLYEHRFVLLHLFPLRNPDTGLLEFNCHQCGFISTSKDDHVWHYIKKHRKKALKEPKKKVEKTNQTFICDICEKKFGSKPCLKQHMRFHITKKFVCEYNGCTREFTTRSDFKDHIRKVHTHERPFLCKFCGLRFLTSPVYYQHRKIHTGERRHKCGICEKAFQRADALKHHLYMHAGEKPYPCPQCTASFRQKGDCKKHMKAIHKTPAFVEPIKLETDDIEESPEVASHKVKREKYQKITKKTSNAPKIKQEKQIRKIKNTPQTAPTPPA